MFIVSPPGIHISLGICVRGYTYHGDTHITVTPVLTWAQKRSDLREKSTVGKSVRTSLPLIARIEPRGCTSETGDKNYKQCYY